MPSCTTTRSNDRSQCCRRERRCNVKRRGLGTPINACRCPDRRLRLGAKRPYPGQRRCTTRSAGNLDGSHFARCNTAFEAPKRQNPVALTDQNLLDGVRLFAQNCAICHGSAKGEASPSPIAKGLYEKPSQFATHGVEDDPEGMSFWKIKHGIRLTGMPSFGYSLSDQEIWTLALFLRHMDKLPPAVQQSWQQVQNWPVTPANQPNPAGAP